MLKTLNLHLALRNILQISLIPCLVQPLFFFEMVEHYVKWRL